jgi:hypothetical protein
MSTTRLKFMGVLTGVLSILALAPPASLAQEEGAEPSEKHLVGLGAGYTHIPEGADDVESDRGVWVFTGGIVYHYRFKDPWSVGAVAEVEFGEYLIVDKDLNRENAVIVAGLLYLEAYPRWSVYFGGGVELEKHENQAIMRLGTEYELIVGDAWAITPTIFVDVKEEFNSYAFAVAIGKWFG